MKTAIGTAMLQLMQEKDVTSVMWGDAWMLDVAFSRSGSKATVRHPTQRWQHVLNALGRDERFEKWFIEIDVGWRSGHTKRQVRCFKPTDV